MGVRVLSDRNGQQAALYCSTTGVAFGPVFSDDASHDADERAESFLRYAKTYVKTDVRLLTEAELQAHYREWLEQELSQWDKEQIADAEYEDDPQDREPFWVD